MVTESLPLPGPGVLSGSWGLLRGFFPLCAVVSEAFQMSAKRADQPLTIFIGGGDAALLAPHLPWPATVWPEMTLEGIRLAAEQLS